MGPSEEMEMYKNNQFLHDYDRRKWARVVAVVSLAVLKGRRGGKFAFEDPRSRRLTATWGHSRSPGSHKRILCGPGALCRRSRRMRINRLIGGCLENFCRFYSVVLTILCLALEI